MGSQLPENPQYPLVKIPFVNASPTLVDFSRNSTYTHAGQKTNKSGAEKSDAGIKVQRGGRIVQATENGKGIVIVAAQLHAPSKSFGD